jgi:hypothetical protein
MIESRTPVRLGGAPGGDHRRRRWRGSSALVLLAVLLAGAMMVPKLWPPTAAPAPVGAASAVPSPGTPSDSAQRSAPAAAPSASGAVPSGAVPSGAAPSGGVPPVLPVPVTALPRDLLQLPGAVPARGSGKFAYASGRGPVLGTKGKLKRFRVAVEQGSNEDPAAFAAEVEATLGDRRSWIGDGRTRLQRVPGNEPADFTVYLATRDTAGRMCRRGGVNITVGGRPYTSCRATGQAIINLDRWRASAGPYLAAKVPLAVYRQYVVNHEVGHEFGQHHQGCPRRGGPAPVMVQQTLSLRGCVPYAWPRRGERRFGGPSL